MTTSKPNDSPEEPTAVASAQAEAGGVEETGGKTETAAEAAERILTSAPSTGRSAVPSALAEPEAEPTSEESGRGRASEETEETEEVSPETLGALTVATASRSSAGNEAPESEVSEAERSEGKASSSEKSSATSPAAADASTATSESESRTTAATAADAGDFARAAVRAAPGRPHKSLLAGAAIVGALLISVPFMISGGDGDGGQSSAKPGATPGTVLDGLAGAAPGVVGSESPSPKASRAKGGTQPKTVTTTTGPDGKPVVVTVSPKATATGGGKKSAQGGGGAAAQDGSKDTSSGSGGTSNDTSSGSGSDSDSSKSGNSSQTSDQWTGGVQIYSHASNRCIGVANSPNAPVGSKLVIWDCYNESYQRWKFVNGTVQSEGKCMNISGGATNNGAVINWTTCNGSGAQQFRLNSSHDLTNPQSGNKCVDVIDQRTDNGARLQLWQCYGTSNQKWSTRTP
ncbi:ricin-type beta-trefoil lectin domain protein [Streptomyces sp. E5N91]|uniref:ricin-type beta-trefoil lectin domain protein n=1 Tax=Streptomyces sp. E5N91 TaxID=1851996 RepID=UPI001290D99C|nr:ricin-type beta-trefoil lectin domain protein [Streptomyces sp. E5N91]